MTSNLCRSNCGLDRHKCNTEIELDEVDFNWTISNFDFHEAKGVSFKSSIFSAARNDKYKWYLLCKPNGVNENKDTISIYVYLTTDVIKSVFAKFIISIMGQQVTSKIREFTAKSNWGWKQFFKKDNDFKNQLALENNKLTIHCSLKFSKMENSHHSFQQYKPNISACNLSEDLELLFKSQEFSDVILSVKGKNYKAHKSILAARSSVFAAMFRHNMKETQLNRVVIEDVNEDVMGEILRYIYTGTCQNVETLAEELLIAADKYALDPLKIICAEELSKTLSVENAANRLILADMHGDNKLKDELMKLIVTKFSEVSKTTSWKNVLSNPQLVDELFQALARR